MEKSHSTIGKCHFFEMGSREGKKSYGLSFTLNNRRKTLTDKQVDKVIKKIFDKLQNEFGAELRS